MNLKLFLYYRIAKMNFTLYHNKNPKKQSLMFQAMYFKKILILVQNLYLTGVSAPSAERLDPIDQYFTMMQPLTRNTAT